MTFSATAFPQPRKMLAKLNERLAKIVTVRWRWVLLTWILIAVSIFVCAPRWNSIAYDGDFEYLPATMNTVAASRVLDQAFPGDRARSQMVIVLGRESEPLDEFDSVVGDDLLRRLHHRLAEICWQRAISLGYQNGPITEAPEPSRQWLRRADEALDQSIELDERFYERFSEFVPEDAPTLTEPRMAIAYLDRAKFTELTLPEEPDDVEPDDVPAQSSEAAAQSSEAAAQSTEPGDETVSEEDQARIAAQKQIGTDYQDALILVPDIESIVIPIEQRELDSWNSVLDLLSWDDSVIGARLNKPSARLAVLQLSSELAATGNIATLESVKELIGRVKTYSASRMDSAHPSHSQLRLEVTGSAAVGGETLTAARDAIRYTEVITVVMILLILTLVYRAPLLVAIPMLSIGVAVLVSTSLIALLTDLSIREVVPLLNMRVFTTSRIFIVVILFGAGTDYCLFLISRLREEAAKSVWLVACWRSLAGVTSALLGSALTTVFGLAMLWFAEFGKYHHTGPVIAICLLTGLLVCLTLTPALLAAMGPKVFWPGIISPGQSLQRSLFSSPGDSQSPDRSSKIWDGIAILLTRRPWATFLLGVFVLAIPGIYGFRNEDSVTYDLSSQLDSQSESRRGYRLLSKHFGIGEINPITVLMVRNEDAPRETLKKQIQVLSDQLYEEKGVTAVRTSNDPLGDFPPDREMSFLNKDSWRRRALQQHRVAQNYFFSADPVYQDRLARLDLIVEGDPFSLDTAREVSDIGKRLAKIAGDEESEWFGSSIYLAGTTPSIIDLRSVTISDNQRIKVAVVIAVFLVLLAVIRRFGLCVYLIATVLLSYYATLGLTVLFFKGVYGTEYVGLDWKLPLFLFVILVAVGQDYNVYLVTRIVEEQRNKGWLAALRHAVSRTGGIITACGMVMAATFLSMTASAWMPGVMGTLGIQSDATPGLRGIIELGFALGLGVLIDTFYVRTILVPSFVTLMGKWQTKRKRVA